MQIFRRARVKAPQSGIGASYAPSSDWARGDGHEHDKERNLRLLREGRVNELPPMFTWWAGARTDFARKYLQPISFPTVFDSENAWDDFLPDLLDRVVYDGKPYLLPIGYHHIAFFYNPKVMDRSGITSLPSTWEDLIDAATRITASGARPFALGSKNRWPAQYWFDLLLLRIAGSRYRDQLLAGKASYQDSEVTTTLKIWKELIDDGYFVARPNELDWTDAADQVSEGKAAMTLIGTWVTSYWNRKGLSPEVDYDFFSFPIIDERVDKVALGPLDGWVVSAGATNREGIFALLREWAKPKIQVSWALEQGALPPNIRVRKNEIPPILQRAVEEVHQASSFSFSYDLATHSEIAEFGLNMFHEFLDNPSEYSKVQAEIQANIVAAFEK